MKRLQVIAALAAGYALGTALRTSPQLSRIERKLEIMGREQEQKLDTAISEMKEAVTSAADRVIQKLGEKDIDLSDEIADVQRIKDAVAGIAPDATTTSASSSPSASEVEASAQTSQEVDTAPLPETSTAAPATDEESVLSPDRPAADTGETVAGTSES